VGSSRPPRTACDLVVRCKLDGNPQTACAITHTGVGHRPGHCLGDCGPIFALFVMYSDARKLVTGSPSAPRCRRLSRRGARARHPDPAPVELIGDSSAAMLHSSVSARGRTDTFSASRPSNRFMASAWLHQAFSQEFPRTIRSCVRSALASRSAEAPSRSWVRHDHATERGD